MVDHMDREISGIGNNTNQLAHMSNINRKIYDEKIKEHPDQGLIDLYKNQMSDIECKMKSTIDLDKLAELLTDYKETFAAICKDLWRVIE